MLGGPGIKSLLPHTQGRYLGPITRLLVLCVAGFVAWVFLCLFYRRRAVQLAVPDSISSLPWVRQHLGVSDVLRTRLQGSFTEQELQLLANCIAPRGNLVVNSGNPQLRPLADLPPRIAITDTVPMLGTDAGRRPKGTKGMSSSIGHLVMWRLLFFDIYNSALTTLKIKFLTHSGHGSVSCLSSVYECSASVARVALRRISGYPALGSRRLTSANSCHACSLASDEPESLERHSVTCADGIFIGTSSTIA